MMKPGLLIDVKSEYSLQPFVDALPGRTIVDWKEISGNGADLSDFGYVLGWHPDQGLFAKVPNLEVMFSYGAGVDHILSDESLPDLPLVRFVDPSLATRMSEWVCLQCLMHLRQQPTYSRQQRMKMWKELSQPDAAEIRVGIMGMGKLGQQSAIRLKQLGFSVNGWSRTRKELEGISCYDGTELDDFLANTDFLVGLLPYTPETKGMFNRSLFDKLAQNSPLGGPVFINGGRGGSQVEKDLIEALECGLLIGASLDVFEQEPLAKNNPLWGMENVIVTPHIASASDINALAQHVSRQVERHEQGEPLEWLVDKQAGY